MRRAVEHRKMFNIIHGTGVTKIDFIVRKDSEYRRLEFSRRRPITIRETRLWLVSPEDLLLSKLLWAKQGESERQLHDVKGMLAFVSEELDWSYVAQWAQQLGVDRLLAQVKS